MCHAGECKVVAYELDCDLGGRLGRRGRWLEFGKLNLNERFAGKMGFIA